MTTTPILIAGAGPTGLVLALSLARSGVPFRLVDENSGPGEHSRAMAIHARTLEFYGQFGFADEIVERGVRTNTVHVHEGGGDGPGRGVITVNFKDLGEGISPYPFLLTYPQDEHERYLVEQLKSLGCEIEWSSKLLGFTQDESGVSATIEHADGSIEKARAEYICGCDGVHSRVRESLAIGFPGGTYNQVFYVADVKIDRGFDRDFNANFGGRTLALMMPVSSSGMQRLIGLVPPELAERRDLTFEDVRGHIEPIFDVKVTEVNWFAAYRVHHRVAEHFRVGRAFLLGDAGHVHSPIGGQGMNTGIGDAVNLGWKLAEVLQGRAQEKLLDTYEHERIEFARTLVATTDRAFTPIVAPGLHGELTRRLLLPFFITVATRFELSRHKLFRALSQTEIHYPESPLSEGEAGDVHSGDRLPWLGKGADNNFAPLRSLDWQLHVYGETAPEIVEACKRLDLPLRQFSWSEYAEKVGFKRDAIYLVRPDGYVALAASQDIAQKLEAFVARFGLTFVSSEANSQTFVS